MTNVAVEPQAPRRVALRATRGEAIPALVAKRRAEMVLATAAGTAVGKTPARHRDENTSRSFDDSKVAHDVLMAQRDRGVCAKAVVTALEQAHTDFSNIHG
jgi:hypothetical protein